MFQAGEKENDRDTRGEQAKSIPRFSSWASDSHLHSVSGKSFTKINVEGCKEIFVPDYTVCFQHDPKTKQDYWVTACPRNRRHAPKWTDWRRWYGPSESWDLQWQSSSRQAGPFADVMVESSPGPAVSPSLTS